jgi:hypothetical protein
MIDMSTELKYQRTYYYLLEKSYTKYIIIANKQKSETNQTDELKLVCADAIDNVLQFIG